MSINSWNDIAHKSEQSAEKVHKRIISQNKIVNGNEFICPWCGKKHSISDAKILSIVASKELIDTRRGFNSTTKTYAKTSYKIRFCEKCYNKNERNKRIFFTAGKVIYVILGILLLYWCFTTEEKLGFTGWLGLIIFYGIIALCAIGLKESVIENMFDTANVEHAYKCNAIA